MPIIDYSVLCFESLEPRSNASPALRSLQRATPHRFQSTSTTSSSVTAAAAFTAGPATSYVGCLLEALDGAARGQVRRISGYAVPGTATVDQAFSPVPDATTTWALWIPPEGIVVVASVIGVTTIRPVNSVDASGRPGRNQGGVEPTGFWITPSRYALVGVGGVNNTRIALVTGWDGTDFTIEANVFAAVSVGDLFLLRKLHQQRGEHQMADLPQAAQTRRSLKTVLDGDPLVMGSRGGSMFQETLEVAPLQAAASGATPAVPPAEAHDLLQNLFGSGFAATSTTVAGSSTTAIRITDTQRNRFLIGQMMLINGEARMIVDSNAGDVTYDELRVSPALTQAPASGVTVYGGATYEHGSQGATTFRSMTIEQYFGAGPGRETIYGWTPALVLEGMDAEGAKLAWTFKGPVSFHYTDPTTLPTWTTAYGGRPPAATYGLPFLARDAIVSLSAQPATGAPAAAGSTGSAAFSQVTLRSLKVDFGFNPVRWQPGISGAAGDEGILIAGLVPAGMAITMALDIDDQAMRQRFEAGAELELMAQFGSTPGGTFAFHARSVQARSYVRKRQDGRFSAEVEFQVNRTNIVANATSGTGTTVPPMFRFAFL